MLGDYKDIQPIVYNILSNEILNNKVSHAYLFDVSSSHNSFLFIYSFIKSIMCPDSKLVNDGCEKCNLCKSIDDRSYPDIIVIEPDGLLIKKEQLLDLQNNFKTKSLYGNKKIYIIRYAENLHTSAANSILKFLEEPESNIIAILLTKSINSVLPTIKSRCQILTLNSSNDESTTYKEKIGQVIYGDLENYQDFIENTNIDEIINGIINFINYYESHGIDTISHTSKLWFEIFTDKKLNMIAYNLLMLYYKDVINYKLNRKLEIFSDFRSSIMDTADRNSLDRLYRKIYLIIEALEKNKININLALNLDNLIMELEDVK